MSLDCSWLMNGNQGCSVRFPSSNSYGPSFNNVGGGWYVFHTCQSSVLTRCKYFRYAVERTSTYYKVWFWPRNAENVPFDVKNGASTATPSDWVRFAVPNRVCPYALFPKRVLLRLASPTPTAILEVTSKGITSSSILHSVRGPFSNCDFFSRLPELRDSRCVGGDWAGAVYADSGCPSTCVGGFLLYCHSKFRNK